MKVHIARLGIASLLTLSIVAAGVPSVHAADRPGIDPASVTVSGTPPGMESGGVKAVFTDPLGKVLATYDSSAPGAAPAPASASGCLSVDAWRNMYTLLGSLAYRWHQTKYFCWSAKKVNSISIGYYVSDNNGFNVFQGISGTAEYFYTYFSGVSNSGHYSLRQASMQNCFVYCGGTFYPWVKIWVRGDGTWTYSTGG